MIELVFQREMYYTTQIYFRHNILETLPNDDKVWAKSYREWIEDQGAILLTSVYDVTTSLGVAPGYSKLQFKDEKLATMFVLRWSS